MLTTRHFYKKCLKSKIKCARFEKLRSKRHFKLASTDYLTQKISNFFSIHPSRKKTLSALILGAISSENVQHHSLSRYVDSPTLGAAERRVERFFKGAPLCVVDYAKALVKLLEFEGKFDLCLDRSNWKFGQKKTNYLVLSWRISKQIDLLHNLNY